MEPERYKRTKRNPLSPEEVANIVAYKKRRALVRLHRFKSGLAYKFQNIFNVSCCFVYLELLFCFFGPCNYRTHYSMTLLARYGNQTKADGQTILSDLDITCVEGDSYNFVIEDFIEAPPRFTSFLVGKDFLLQKDLKGMLALSEAEYRVFSASPILFLSVFVLVISLGAFLYNLNVDPYSSMALTVLNAMAMLGICLL